jgi:Dyp-type peroxidase family
MSKLDETDIQGFVLRGYNLPFARYMFLEISHHERGQEFIGRLLDLITTGEHWDEGKPQSTVNIAFTHRGLIKLNLPDASLLSFPVEFLQGMKARGEILYDKGKSGPENWDEVWQGRRVHAWLGVNAISPEALNAQCKQLQDLMTQTGGASIVGSQDAAALKIDGKWTSKEHFGYTDGFGNPDFQGVERHVRPGQGKLTKDGGWAPLATGELLLDYPDEAGELPVAPIPHLLARNGTFMVYRKLHQNVATFRRYLDEKGKLYPGGKEKLASKFIGRWRDGTPVELSPDQPDPAIVNDKARNVDFTFGKDPNGARCPIGAHLRRVNPRDAFGFNGQLINRRRITRRGLPYGPYIPEDQPVRDQDEHGVIFIVLNASLSRQFEFVQQQWIEYGNDSKLGNERDILLGNHGGEDGQNQSDRALIQGTEDPSNPPFMCGGLPNFVELRGGDYFFLPSMTALRMIASGTIDPR